MKACKVLGALGLFLSLLAVAPRALADPPEKKGKGDVEYVFQDGDRLTAETLGGAGTQVNVMKGGNRQRLLRPRTSFVTEMLKSVEAL